MTGLHRRILVAELDSVATRRLYEDYAESASQVEARLVGALRLAHLVGGQILVTEAMLFDSRFFAGLTPEDLADLLGTTRHRLPITVLHRAETLRESLDALLDPEGGFRWQLAGGRAGRAWVDQPLSGAWDRWISASEQGRLGMERMLTRPDGTPKPAFGPLPEMSSPVAHPDVDAMVEATALARRSAVFDAYDRGVVSDPPPHVRAELRRLRAAYNGAYFAAMARQHDAEWVSFTPQGEASADAAGRSMLRISGHLVGTAVDAPAAVFAQVLHATRPEQEAFARSGRRRHLLALVYKAGVVTSARGMWEDARTLVRSVVLAALAVLIAVPGLDDGSGWLPWSIFGLSIAVAIPWDAPASLRSMLPSRLDASLSVSSG